MNDLIIGIASGYFWDETTLKDKNDQKLRENYHIESFVVSLRRSGYNGRCILIVGEDQLPHDKIKKYGIEVRSLGNFVEHPIRKRFTEIAKVVEEDDFRYVLAVDTKDVVFQSDPTMWIEQNIGNYELIVVSEGGTYSGDTAANKENKIRMIDTFGEQEFDCLKNQQICNGGVVAGLPNTVKELSLAIYDLALKVPSCKNQGTGPESWPADQEVLNYLINSVYFKGRTLTAMPENGFAFLGDHINYGAALRNGVIYPPNSSIPYAIFHQYLGWKDQIWSNYAE